MGHKDSSLRWSGSKSLRKPRVGCQSDAHGKGISITNDDAQPFPLIMGTVRITLGVENGATMRIVVIVAAVIIGRRSEMYIEGMPYSVSEALVECQTSTFGDLGRLDRGFTSRETSEKRNATFMCHLRSSVTCLKGELSCSAELQRTLASSAYWVLGLDSVQLQPLSSVP